MHSPSARDAVDDDFVHIAARDEHLEAQITQLREQVASLRQRVESLEADRESSASGELENPQQLFKGWLRAQQVSFQEQLGQQQARFQEQVKKLKMETADRGAEAKPLFHPATIMPEESYKRELAVKVLATRRLIQQAKQQLKQQEPQEDEHAHNASLGGITATDKPRGTMRAPFGYAEAQ